MSESEEPPEDTKIRRHFAFRAMLSKVCTQLTEEELKLMVLTYKERIGNVSSGYELAEELLECNCIQCDSVADLNTFKETLINRNDLQKLVGSYMDQWTPLQVEDPNVVKLPVPQIPSSLKVVTDKDQDLEAYLENINAKSTDYVLG